MSDTQKIAALELQLQQLEDDRNRDWADFEAFKRDTEAFQRDAETFKRDLGDKAQEILQALVGTLKDKGLITSFHNLKDVVLVEIKPRVDTLWTDRIRVGAIYAFISMVLAAVVAAAARHFLP